MSTVSHTDGCASSRKTEEPSSIPRTLFLALSARNDLFCALNSAHAPLPPCIQAIFSYAPPTTHSSPPRRLSNHHVLRTSPTAEHLTRRRPVVHAAGNRLPVLEHHHRAPA